MAADSTFTPNPSDPDLISHERTYRVFNILLRWSMTLLAAGISFLTLWFATSAGLVGGAIVGLIVFVGGYYFLVKHEEHQPLDVWQEGR
jgi:hypothetical protein